MCTAAAGCSDHAPNDANPGPDAATAPEAASGRFDGPLRVRFLSPARGAPADGLVTVEVVAESAAPIVALEVTTPAGLVDTDPAPDRARVEWNAGAGAPGPVTLTARAEDTSGAEATADLSLTVDPDAFAHVSGVVSLGRPVRGATVRLTGPSGEALGAAVTGEDGVFSVPVRIDGWSGPARLRVTGPDATTTEVATGESRSFDLDDELLAAVTVQSGALAGVSVNGLTTLAVRLADAYLESGLDNAQQQASARLAAHLGVAFEPALTPVLDLSETESAWPLPRTALSLFHAGLSQLAGALGTPAAPVSSVDVLQALGRDLSDGVFDGEDTDGAPLWILGEHPVDADATRWTLAFHTDAWVESLAGAPPTIDYATLAADDGYYTAVSTDDGPLYPPEPAPLRFDRQAPAVAFVEPPTPPPGSFVRLPFTISATVTDASPLASISLVKPAGDASATASGLTAELDPATLADGPLTVVVRAEDASGNEATGQRALVVDTTPPQVALTIPAVVAPTATLGGTATDATSGVASVTLSAGESSATPALAGDAFGAVLPLSPGPVPVSAVATDHAGNTATVTRQVVVDDTPPLLATVGPPSGSPVSGAPMVVHVTWIEPNGLASVTATVGETVTTLSPADDGWAGELVPPPGPGFSATLSATDVAGNVGESVASWSVDATPPVLESVAVESGAESDGDWWTATETSTLLVVAADPGSGIASVCSADPCNGEPSGEPDTWRLTIDTSAPESTHPITVTDGVGRTTSLAVTVRLDDEGPACTLDVPEHGLWFNTELATLTGAASDAGVGGIVITAETSGPPSVGFLTEDQWEASVALPPGASTALITCADALGNETGPLPVVVNLDQAPPVVTLAPTKFFLEDILDVELTEKGPHYPLPANVQFVDIPADCSTTGSITTCPQPFIKYTSRLREASENLPTFDLVAVDSAATSLVYRFETTTGVPLMTWRAVPASGAVALSIEQMSDEPDVFNWMPDKLPARLAVQATDLAGNQSDWLFQFTLSLKVPPLFLLPLTLNADLPEAGGVKLDSPAVYGLFNPSGPLSQYEGLWISRFELRNPHEVPVEVRLDHGLKTDLTIQSQRGYLHTGTLVKSYDDLEDRCLWGNACTNGSCYLDWTAPPSGGHCAVAPPDMPREVEIPVQAALALYDDGETSAPLAPNASDGYRVVPPLTSITVAAVVQTPATCALRQPKLYEWALPDGSERSAWVYHGPESAPSCAEPGTASYDDTTTCNVGPYNCYVEQYASPRVVTSLRITASGTGAPGVHVVQRHRVPGFTEENVITHLPVVEWEAALDTTGIEAAPYVPQ